MPTTRPFAFNPGSPIAGTEQVGDIAVGISPQNYSGGYGGVRWWNGPDEDLGYIICYSVPTEDHPSPDGPIAGVGFFRSKFLTEPSFIEIAEYVSNGQTFATGADAKTWLNANGYWTSYDSVSVTPTPTVTPTNTVTPTPSTTPSSSNLLVYLDSGNPSSYPGTGNTWFDLEGTSNDATLFNSPTYSSSYQGILQFDDVSLEYATIPDLGNLNQWTVEAWFRLSAPLTGKVTSIISNEFDLVDKLNFSIGTNNQPANANLSVGFYDGLWRTTTGVVPQVGVWYQVVGTYDGSVIRQYVNGVASGGTVNYVGTPESGGEVRLMRRWDGVATQNNLVDGDLAIIKIYNSVLNASEVLSNYNLTYTRFLDITPTPTVTSTPTQTPTNTQTPTITPSSNIVTSNLVLDYNFEDVDCYPGAGTTVFDLSTPQYNGTLFNSPTHSYGDGGYFDFNGINQYIEIAHDSALKPTSAITMEQWLWADDWNAGVWPTAYLTPLSNTQGGGYAHYLGSGIFVSYVRSGGVYQTVSGTTTSFSGWHNFTTTFDGRFTKLYINGLLEDTVDMGTSGNPIQYAFNNSLLIGAEAGSSTTPQGFYWDGKISITRIYNSALSESQVLQNYNFSAPQFVLSTPTPTVSPTPTLTPEPTLTPTPSSTPTPPSSGFTATVQQVGLDVIWSGSGTFNLTDLTIQTSNTLGAGYAANQAIWAAGPMTPVSVEQYGGASFTTYPTTFDSGTGSSVAASSGSGDLFGILPGTPFRVVVVPAGYTSGNFISGITTYENTTISAMGLSGGTYTWEWGTSPNTSTLTLEIIP